MKTQQGSLSRGRIGRGLLLSLFLHAQVLAPLLVWLFWWGKPGDDEVEVTFQDVKDEDLPPDLPSVDKPPAAAPSSPSHPRLAPVPPPPKPALRPEPPPETPPPEKPKPEERPKIEDTDLSHQKIVDLDLGKEVEAPKDAKYLAQRNNRTDHETRARQTNLDKAQSGAPAEPSDDSDKIAHAEEQEERAGHRSLAPGEKAAQEPKEPRPTLSMRSPPGAGASPGETEQESPDGLLQKLRRGPPGREGDRRAADEPASPHLTGQGYAAAFGDDKALAAAMAKQEKSKHKGKFSEHKEKVLAALENFINEVTPSNQTELNTRAAPFAQFITRMHRQIHEKWAFGFLNQMDASFRDSPMNDMALVAKLEIVLDKAGHVDRISMVRTSGNTGFDAAAISSVYAAEPFPVPPEAILSGNEKVYIHWKFHRNGDACGTPGVSYFILDNGSKRRGDKDSRAGSPGTKPAHG